MSAAGERGSVVAEADAQEAGLGDDVGLGIDHLQLACHVLQRDGGDHMALDGHHIAEFTLRDHQRCRGTQAGGEDPVVGAGSAAPLHVARDGDPHFFPGFFQDLAGDLIGDRGILLQHFFQVLLVFFLNRV